MFNNYRAKLWLKSVSKKSDIDLFWSSGSLSLPHLLGKQIIAILEIIDAELITSFGFGLRVLRVHVLKEKTVILVVLNTTGGIEAMKRQFSFDEAKNTIFDLTYKMLEEENHFYFEKFQKEGEVKTKYNCHLEAVILSVLRSIYDADGRIPYVGNPK